MKLVVSSPPHWHVKLTESRVHLDFIIALVPAVILAVYNYGMHAVRVIALAVSAAVISEILIRKLFRKSSTFTDGSAFYIGLLFAMLLPASVPWWLVIVGAFVCIFIGKELFGGLGSFPLNPVLVGWAVVKISWPAYLNVNLASAVFDLGFDFRYPLAVLRKGGIEAIKDMSFIDLLLGKQAGGLGASAIGLILIGGIYLLLRKRIPWEIPLSYTVGVLSMAGLFWVTSPSTYVNPFFHLITGNVMIGIFFLATDYSSSPFNRWGMVLFGLGCGILTVLFRVWSVNPQAVPFALLLMSLFTPLLDRVKKKPGPINVCYMEKQLS